MQGSCDGCHTYVIALALDLARIVVALLASVAVGREAAVVAV